MPTTITVLYENVDDATFDLDYYMAERGCMGRQRATGYGKRNHAETTMGRHKRLVGPKLRARMRSAQLGEAALAVQVLNRMIRTAKPVSVRR